MASMGGGGSGASMWRPAILLNAGTVHRIYPGIVPIATQTQQQISRAVWRNGGLEEDEAWPNYSSAGDRENNA